MFKNDHIVSVAQQLQALGINYPSEVAVSNRETERGLVELFSSVLNPADMPTYSYKRYGYLLSNLVAQLFAFDIGAGAMDFSGRLFNCGMAAISTILEALELKPGDRIVCSKVLYSETPKELKSLARFGVEVVEVNQQDFSQLTTAIEDGNTKLVFVETVGNGPTMPVVDFPKLLECVSEKDLTIILDNTFFTTALFNPFTDLNSASRLYHGRFRFIYLESASKFYRVGEDDEVTCGIVVAPDNFIPTLDSVTSRRGTYIPFPALKQLPWQLSKVCAIVNRHSRNAFRTYNWLKQQDWIEPIYPWIPFSKGGGGTIIYAQINSDSVEQVQQFIAEAELVQVGSFGHAFTSVIHFGKYPEFGHRAGQIRLAVGFQEDPNDTIARMDSAARKIFKA